MTFLLFYTYIMINIPTYHVVKPIVNNLTPGVDVFRLNEFSKLHWNLDCRRRSIKGKIESLSLSLT